MVQTHISELRLREFQKMILAYCVVPRTCSQISIKLDKNYSWVWQTVNRLAGNKYLIRIDTYSNKVLYKLNEKTVML